MTTQGSVQGARLLSSTPIHEILVDTSTSKKLKEKLSFVLDVKQFAKTHGLEINKSYTEYVDLGDEKAISYLVMAAPRLKLKLKTWNYIIVGSFPYQGFFNQKDRDKYAAFLDEKMNLDVSKTSAAAFSLLGWLKDPVYSTMFKMSRLHLARTLFHELTHATVWINDAVKFNETLAEFVAEHLITLYWKNKNPEKWTEYKVAKSERPKFILWMKKLRSELEDFYNEDLNLSIEEKLSKKQKIIHNHVSKYPDFKSKRWSRLKNLKWNNAKILGVSLYVDDHSEFSKSFSCFKSNHTIGEWLNKLKHQTLKTPPFQSLKELCPPPPTHQQK